VKFYIGVIIALTAFLTVQTPTNASIGVGVGTGKIVVDSLIKPGSIYLLPSIVVTNTGDESSDYTTAPAYHEGQKELMPPKEWFIFEPKVFHLEPGQAQQVTVKLDVPIKAEPGDYFAYLDASPVKTSSSGGATIGVAAASKLYFKVAPANIFEGIYHRVVSIWKELQPWSGRALYLAGIVIALLIFRKFFKVQLNVKPKKPLPKDKSGKDKWDSAEKLY